MRQARAAAVTGSQASGGSSSASAPASAPAAPGDASRLRPPPKAPGLASRAPLGDSGNSARLWASATSRPGGKKGEGRGVLRGRDIPRAQSSCFQPEMHSKAKEERTTKIQRGPWEGGRQPSSRTAARAAAAAALRPSPVRSQAPRTSGGCRIKSGCRREGSSAASSCTCRGRQQQLAGQMHSAG